MSYNGQRITINNVNIPSELISPGSYKFIKPKRIVGTWEDANQVEHQDILTDRKANISFELRVRTLADHESICGIFADQENISVTYWDDYDCEYKTGTFYMDAPEINHINSQSGSLLYNATLIKLTEY